MTASLPIRQLESCGHINICYRTLTVVRISEQVTFSSLLPQIFWQIFRAMRDALRGVKSYLSNRSEYEPNPYYQGRYLVALLVCAYNHVSHPYEVSEILFRNSRFATKVDLWLADRCERFPYLAVRFDGSLAEWKEPQVDRASLPQKKTVQAEKLKKAKAA